MRRSIGTKFLLFLILPIILIGNSSDEEKVDIMNSPLVKIKGYFLDGKVFMNKKCVVWPKELEIGKDIIGMKKGEIKKIFIKDENPRIFEVEILKIDKIEINKKCQIAKKIR